MSDIPTCSYCGRHKDGGNCVVCDGWVCDQCQMHTAEGPICPDDECILESLYTIINLEGE